jgi:transposase
MRKGFEGVYGLVRDRLSCKPLSGHLFLFCNAQRNRLKVLVCDGSGLWVCAKRLVIRSLLPGPTIRDCERVP